MYVLTYKLALLLSVFQKNVVVLNLLIIKFTSMKTHLFNITIMLGVLVYLIYQSVNHYNDAGIEMVLAMNLIETACLFITTINFLSLIKWSKLDVKYHNKLGISLSFVIVFSLNILIFTNSYNSFLYLPLFLAFSISFYLIAKRNKKI